MPSELILRLDTTSGQIQLPATLLAAGRDAASHLDPAARKGPELLLKGDRDYLVALHTPLDAEAIRALKARKGRSVHVISPSAGLSGGGSPRSAALISRRRRRASRSTSRLGGKARGRSG
jgi:hypothetical protein